MDAQFSAAAEAWLTATTQLPAKQRQALAGLAPELLRGLPAEDFVVIGISGAPGTGKSTLAHMLRSALAAAGEVASVLSLDDYYLSRMDREKLAQTMHPLFAVRGVPGTHDLELLRSHLLRLRSGDLNSLTLPRFDKASDERLPEAVPWRGPPPRVVFLEGWCVGAPPPSLSAIRIAPNAVERQRDPAGRWRHAVRTFCEEYDERLNTLLDRRWFLDAPDWRTVVDWRWQQEQELGGRRRFSDRGEVADFLATFEWLSRHMHKTCWQWADRVIGLGRDHCPLS
jgi:D-glycerate 3-kinase